MDMSFGNLFSQLIIGLLGMSFFMYGKKAQRLWPLLAGAAMCIYPFFVTNLWALWAVSLAVIVAVFLLRDR